MSVKHKKTVLQFIKASQRVHKITKFWLNEKVTSTVYCCR